MSKKVTVVSSIPADEKSVVVMSPEQAMQKDAQFLSMWLDEKSDKTQRAYASDIHRFYASISKPLAQVTLPDIQLFRRELGEQGLKPATIARTLAAVKSALSFAAAMRYIPFNVGAAAHLPKLEDTLAERIMSEAQIARILALETSPRNLVLLSLLYHAGLRAQELCQLQWRHVQKRGDAGQLAIFGKGRKTRYVKLTPTMWQELQVIRPLFATPEMYVFQSRQARSRTGDTQHRMDESMVYRIVKRAAIRAGVAGNVSPHWMRHAHATHSLENGAPITLVKETLGHKSIETTAKYTHVRPDASSGQYLKV